MIGGNHSCGEGGRKTRGSSHQTSLAAVGSTTTVAATGCLGGGGGDPNEPIRYLSNCGDSRDVMDEIVAEFEEGTDHTVEMIYTAKGTSSDAEMQKMIVADSPPDLLFGTSTDAYRLQHDGVLVPVTGAVQGSDLPDPVTVGDESYFTVAMVEPLMGRYRNDVYSGLPTSWSGWVEVAGEVSVGESMEGYVIQSGQTNNVDTQMTQYPWRNDVEVYGGPFDDTEVRLNDDDGRQTAVKTFEWIQSMAEYSPNGLGWAWDDIISTLQQENAAAIASVGGLPTLTIQASRPSLVENLSPMPFPMPNGTAQDKWWAYMEGHLVCDDDQDTKGAQAFVDFFTSSSRFFDFVLSALLFQFPPTREQLDAPEVTRNEAVQRHPDVMNLARDNWGVLTSVLATGDGDAPNIVATDAYSEQLFGQAVNQLLVGGLTPDETVDWLAEQLHGLQ